MGFRRTRDTDTLLASRIEAAVSAHARELIGLTQRLMGSVTESCVAPVRDADRESEGYSSGDENDRRGRQGGGSGTSRWSKYRDSSPDSDDHTHGTIWSTEDDDNDGDKDDETKFSVWTSSRSVHSRNLGRYGRRHDHAPLRSAGVRGLVSRGDRGGGNSNNAVRKVVVPPGPLGINVTSTSRGPVVSSVAPSGCLRALREGDLLLKLDDRDLTGLSAAEVIRIFRVTKGHWRTISFVGGEAGEKARGGVPSGG